MKRRITRVATDVGGTFTDLVCFESDVDSGALNLTTVKSDTTVPDLETGVMNVLRKSGIKPSEIDFLAHGTTVVINAIAERKGVVVGLATAPTFSISTM